MTSRTKLLAFVTGAALIATSYDSSPAFAQGLALEEIVVTARKRAESLQDTPVAITAFESVDLQNAAFENILDVAKAAPGVFVEAFNSLPARINTTPRFRGISLLNGNPLAQTAGIFIDGIPIVGGIQGVAVRELERVEIIKGPQSALFGRNTFAGAINYVTKDPRDEFGSDVSLLAATRDEYRVGTTVEGPISDTLGVRVNANYDYNGGHYDNIAVAGQELGKTSTWSISGTMVFEPTDMFRSKIRVHYYQDDDGPSASQAGTGIAFHNFGGFTRDPVTGNADINEPFDGPAVRGVDTESVFRGIVRQPPENTIGLSTGADSYALLINTWDNDARSSSIVYPAFDIHDNGKFGLRRDAFRLAGDFTFDINDDITFTVTAGYNTDEIGLWRDFDTMEEQSYLTFQSRRIKDLSVEARLAGTLLDGDLAWSLGGNYVDIQINNKATTANTRGFAFFFGSAFTPVDETGAKTPAVFGTIDYQITEEFSIIAEGRYQVDEISNVQINAGLATPISPAKFKKFLPRVILNYEPNDDTLLYANWSVGNLPGGFNQQVGQLLPPELAILQALAPGADTTFGEERLQNFELGWKQTAFDNQVAFNLATFYMKRSDELFVSIELVPDTRPNAPNPLRTVGFQANGATTDIYGLELDATANVTENLTLQGSLAYIDGTIASFPEGEGSGDFGDIFGPQADVKGQQAPRFPPWSGSINATYEHSLSNSGTFGMFNTWYTRADVFYTGNYFTSNANVAKVEKATDVNLRTGFRSDNLQVELFVTNLFDEDAPAAAANFADLSFDVRERPGGNFDFSREGNRISLRDKRQFGLRVNYSF